VSQPAAIGIDIGGTKIAVGLVDGGGRIIEAEQIPTDPTSDGLDRTARTAERLIDHARSTGRTVEGIGLGIPEVVDLDGEVTSSSVVGWSTGEIRYAFAALGPVQVDSDVRMAALAEARFGAGVGIDLVLFINIGTGISHSLIVEGRTFAGANGRAILCGSTTTAVLDKDHDQIMSGRIEDAASGAGMTDRYRRKTGRTVDVRAFFAAVEAGDGVARSVRDDAVRLVGGMTANMIDILDPAIVILGGGIAATDDFVEAVDRTARALVWAGASSAPPIVPAGLGPAAGMIGAAVAVMSNP
jgi:glucokinase